MTTELRFRAFCAALVALFTVAGCASPAAQGSAYMDTSRVPAALRSDYESFAVNCSKCHQLSRALNAPVTNVEHWDLYVARMMRTAGSAISPEEKPKILRFLHWYTESYKGAQAAGSEVKP
jgi:hypothetical protein